MAGNEHLIAYLQRIIGYALTGSTQEQCCFLLHGSGANGKSTLLEVVRTLLGDYAQSTPSASLFVKRYEGIPNDIARMRGARFITAAEIGKQKHLDEELIKRLTGQDTMTARFLYGEYFDFRPEFKLFVACNDLPVISEDGYAMWRRIRLLPFGVTIPPERQNKHLTKALHKELPGILAWAVQGCLTWQLQEGLDEPAEVQQATDTYKAEMATMDTVGQFIARHCIVAPRVKVQARLLYQEYQTWCAQADVPIIPVTQREFGRSMTAKGFERRTSDGTWYQGIALRSNREEPLLEA